MNTINSQFDFENDIEFEVFMPNGETFRTQSSDNIPPNRPNKLLQISS